MNRPSFLWAVVFFVLNSPAGIASFPFSQSCGEPLLSWAVRRLQQHASGDLGQASQRYAGRERCKRLRCRSFHLSDLRHLYQVTLTKCTQRDRLLAAFSWCPFKLSIPCNICRTTHLNTQRASTLTARDLNCLFYYLCVRIWILCEKVWTNETMDLFLKSFLYGTCMCAFYIYQSLKNEDQVCIKIEIVTYLHKSYVCIIYVQLCIFDCQMKHSTFPYEVKLLCSHHDPCSCYILKT